MWNFEEASALSVGAGPVADRPVARPTISEGSADRSMGIVMKAQTVLSNFRPRRECIAYSQ